MHRKTCLIPILSYIVYSCIFFPEKDILKRYTTWDGYYVIILFSARFPIPHLSELSVQLEHLKLAVLKLMIMNQRLYAFLFSNTFDVPDYEKKNIAYNSQVSSLLNFFTACLNICSTLFIWIT